MSKPEAEAIETKEATELEDLDNLFEDEGDPKYEFLKTLYKTGRHLNFITDLLPPQIDAIAKAYKAEDILKEEFGITLGLEDMIREEKEMLVSKKRKGREEAIKPLMNDATEQKKGIMRILGLRSSA